jgi:polyhydroxyalkanoate synthesis regulator phasin
MTSAERGGDHEAPPSSADWRTEIADLRAELEALRERVQQLEGRPPAA